MTDKNNTSSLIEAQLERETAMRALGAQRYDEGLDKQASRASKELGTIAAEGPYKRLTRAALPETVAYLEKKIEALSTKNATTLRSYRAVEAVGLHKASFFGLSVCFARGRDGGDLRRAAITIGRHIEDELWTTSLKEEDPKVFSKIFKKVTPSKRKQALKKEFPGTWQGWDEAAQLHCGMVVINAILVSSGLLDIDAEDNSLRFSKDVIEWIKEAKEQERWMRPLYGPMVVCPSPWKSLKRHEGPYLSEALNRSCKLVRGRHDKEHHDLIRQRIDHGMMRGALDALNSIQSTPYRINERMIEVVEWAWKQDLGGELVKKLPRASLVDVPTYPQNFQELPVEEQRRLKQEVRSIHSLNRAIESSALAFHTAMEEAKDLAQYERFWLPHNLDFRGRVYPIPNFNHQREDYVSCLFEFADGLPLGERGAYWLALHLVGCGEFDGVHKQPFEDRYNWVLDNEASILAAAENPYEELFWLNADKPFAFLAACFDWLGYRREGESYVSRTRIAFDGSNSGLQHYSAALRAENDAFHVNLRDTETPQDVYSAVAGRVLACLEEADADTSPRPLPNSPWGAGDNHRQCGDVLGRKNQDVAQRSEVASLLRRQWLSFGVNRKTVKRQVMTYAYSSEKYGFADQIDRDQMKPLWDKVLAGKLPEHPFGPPTYYTDEGQPKWRASNYMAGLIWDAIHEVISGASTGMQWFKDVAKLLASENKPVVFTNPVGFPVIHRYEELDAKTISVFVFDQKIPVLEAKPHDRLEEEGVFRRVRANLLCKPTGRLVKRKQKSAVAPNIIHSMDSAHLLRIVLHSLDEGINTFSMIHDSFATHAGNAERFFWIIREALVEMYEDYDVFNVLFENACAQLSPEARRQLPLPPQKGDLDLQEVLKSKYSFC